MEKNQNKPVCREMTIFVQGTDLAENFPVSSNSRRIFFIKVDCINYGDAVPAHLKLDFFLIFFFWTNPESVPN